MEYSRCCNAISVDLEEWFHGLLPDQDYLSGFERRLHIGTEKLLKLFREYEIKATFFVLGDVAKQSPDLIIKIANEGHEIGSHCMHHKFIYRQSPSEFHRHLRSSIDILTSIINKPIKSFRAPIFSITKDSFWALEILQNEGIKYDSSIFPVHNPRYGIPNSSRTPYEILPGLWEWPVSTLPSPIGNIPFGGGFYLRFWPMRFINFALKINDKRKDPILLYIHPWELDPDHPYFKSKSFFNNYRHYYHLDKTMMKFRQIIKSRKFTTLAEGIKNIINLKSIAN